MLSICFNYLFLWSQMFFYFLYISFWGWVLIRFNFSVSQRQRSGVAHVIMSNKLSFYCVAKTKKWCGSGYNIKETIHLSTSKEQEKNLKFSENSSDLNATENTNAYINATEWLSPTLSTDCNIETVTRNARQSRM
nr:uncharacterized protein LOC105849666 isoform X1 [Hydra vulgaris]